MAKALYNKQQRGEHYGAGNIQKTRLCFAALDRVGNRSGKSLQSNLIQRNIDRTLKSGSKLAYIKKRLAVSELDIKRPPYYSRHPKMVWLMRASRPFKMIRKRKRIVKELKLLKNTKPNNTDS